MVALSVNSRLMCCGFVYGIVERSKLRDAVRSYVFVGHCVIR